MLDVPARLDRALGDVHAAGNPHVHLDPRNIAKIAAALSSTWLSSIAPKMRTIATRPRRFSNAGSRR